MLDKLMKESRTEEESVVEVKEESKLSGVQFSRMVCVSHVGAPSESRPNVRCFYVTAFVRPLLEMLDCFCAILITFGNGSPPSLGIGTWFLFGSAPILKLPSVHAIRRAPSVTREFLLEQLPFL